MKTIFNFLVGVCTTMFLIVGAVAAENQPPKEGGMLPAIILDIPKETGHQAYLGVTGKDGFKIPEIRAEIVIIEIFNMY